MRLHHGSPGRISYSAQGHSFRVSLIVSCVFALGLLFFGQAEAQVFERVRQAVENATNPFYEFVGPPIRSARDSIGGVFRVFEVYRENKILREQNAELVAWRNAALALERKLARYDALLEVPLEPDIQYRTARVVGDPGGPFVRTMRINLGRDDGVIEGQAATGADGLVGRVVSAGPHAARILLLTDLNSRVPVMLEPSGVRGMLIGQNDSLPIITYLPKDTEVEIGANIVTSGHGGVLPPGLPVGTVTSLSGKDAVVRPASRLDQVMFLRVLDYQSPHAQVPYSTSGPPILNAHQSAVSTNVAAAAGLQNAIGVTNTTSSPSTPTVGQGQ